MKFEALADQTSDGHRQSQPGFCFTLEHGEFAGQSFLASLLVCPDPCCPCGIANVACAQETPDAPTLLFNLDVPRREVQPLPSSSPAALSVGRAFLDEAAEPAWVWLGDVFLAAKRKQMETLDLDRLVVDLPADVKAGRGSMVAYAEIFPWAETLKFEYAGATWLADDQHCVRPGCDCTESCLGLIRFPPPEQRTGKPLHVSLVVFYDHANRHIGQVDMNRDRFDPVVLIANLRLAHPDLEEKLRQRHRHLQALGRRLLPKSQGVPTGLALDGEAADWLLQPPDPRLESLSRDRPGRNDPCPCGSGRKFKKCCGSPSRPRAA